MKKVILIIMMLFLTTMFFVSDVKSNDDLNNVTIYFFWGDGCPHCETQKDFFYEFIADYETVEIKMFETWKITENVEVLEEMGALIGENNLRGVPVTFVNDQMWVGFNQRTGENIKSMVDYCLENECRDLGKEINYNSNYVETMTIDDAKVIGGDSNLPTIITISLVILLSIGLIWFILKDDGDEIF
ncbi:MAG: glutaredoxin family protein [Candidatus Woesearchaeota archaeon]